MNTTRKTKYHVLGLILFLGSGMWSCSLSDEDNSPAPEDLLKQALPQVQYFASNFTGTDIARYQLIWMQQLGAVRGSHLQVDKYNMSDTYLDDHWLYFYNNIYYGCQNLMGYATEIDAPAYRAISRIIQAKSLGLMTDTWGDMPYRYGLNYFAGQVYPTYDSQNDIYDDIFELLDYAISDIQQATASNSLKPAAAEDLIYQGDLQQWNKAAHVLKMRFMLRLANLTGDYQQIISIAESGNVFTGLQDDMLFEFNPELGADNPHFTNDNHVKNTRMGKHFVDMLIEYDDPRLEVFVKRNNTNQFVGTAPGEGLLNASFVGTQIASRTASLPLITYTEQKFIEAEVYYHAQMQQMADMAYSQAVKSSLAYYNIFDPEWEETHAEIENVTLEQIINAKYIALFLQPEVWTDFRRTGYPQLAPFEESEQNEIPRRFIYPLNENQNNNHNVPPDVDIFTRMWWDNANQEE